MRVTPIYTYKIEEKPKKLNVAKRLLGFPNESRVFNMAPGNDMYPFDTVIYTHSDGSSTVELRNQEINASKVCGKAGIKWRETTEEELDRIRASKRLLP